MKILITLFTAVLLCQAISAQTTLIPDANFEQALIDLGYDTGTPDGSVPTGNINTIRDLNVSWKNISDLTGIEDFTALTILICRDNYLTHLDVSYNDKLEFLNCRNNQLIELEARNNPVLKTLRCSNNQLSSLDIRGSNTLSAFSCWENELKGLEINNPNERASLRAESPEHIPYFSLYPNPAANYIVVETDQPSQLTLYNKQGKLLLAKLIDGTHKLNLSILPRDVYLFKATDKQGRVYSQKIIKE